VLVLLLIALLLVAPTTPSEQECVVGDDGSCMENEGCVDKHESCDEWARSYEECYNNPNYMLRQCPRACNMCDKSPSELDTLVADILEEQRQEKEELEL